MHISDRRTTKRKITAALAATSALIVAAVTVLLITVVRELQPEHDDPETATGPAPPGQSPALSQGSSRTQPFRFPELRQVSDSRDREWRTLGARKPGDDSYESVSGFLQHRILHFTFDDGPFNETTPKLLDMLSVYNVRATFFVVGKYLFGPDAQVHRDLLRRAEKEGHTVAIHSYTHKDFRHLSAAQINRELYRSGRLLETILGYHPGLFRPPYGGRSLRTNSLLNVRGYTEILWNIAPEEYSARTPPEILGNFKAALDRQEQHGHGSGGIVLLHDNRPRTVKAFPLLMEELRRRNCALIHQDGQELWDVVGDLSYFLLDGDQLPGDLVARRQVLARTAAARYCVGHG